MTWNSDVCQALNPEARSPKLTLECVATVVQDESARANVSLVGELSHMASYESASTYIVRRFDLRDAAAIEAIAKRSPEAAQWSCENYEKIDERDYLAWVAEAGGTPVGFLVARGTAHEAEILNIAVDPASRRTGIAGSLLRESIAVLRRLEVTSIFLEVRESNVAAISCYRKHGFAITGQRPGYYQNPAEAAVLLGKKLAG